MAEIYDFEVQNIAGTTLSMSEYKNKVLLIVNTASKCGFTPQFEGLQELYKDLHEQGLEVLGFPCNQFMNQDPGTNDSIGQFCQLNFGVTFPMFAKIDVNGDDAHPLYQYLKHQASGLLGSEQVKWNFTKFLVGRDGKVLKRYPPTTKPADIRDDISEALG